MVAIRGSTPVTGSISGVGGVSVTCTAARQPQAGDVLLIIHTNDFYLLSNMNTPTVGGSSTGVVAVTGGTADKGTNASHIKSYTYVVGSTGDLTVAVTETGTADEEKALIVYVLSGVDTATPVDVAGNATAATSVSHVAPSISPATSNAMLFCHVNTDATGGTGVTYTPPGGMAETCDVNVASFMATSGANLQLASSGATGTKTFTASTTEPYGAISVAIRSSGTADQNQANSFVPWRRWFRQRGMFLSTYDLLTDRSPSTATSFTGTANVAVNVGISAPSSAVGTGSVGPVVAITATGNMAASGTASVAETVGRTATGTASGAASVSPSVAITAAGVLALSGTAAVSATATLTAAGTAAGSASVAETVSVTATGNMTATGTASVAETVTITATGTAAGSAAVAVSVGITATGTLVLTGTASAAETIGISAAGSGAGTATVAETIGITSAGAGVGSATRAVTVGTTAAGSGAGSASVAVTVGITATGSLSAGLTGSANVAETVGITAAGNMTATGSASVTETVNVTAAGATSGTASRTVSVTVTAAGGLVFTGTATRTVTVAATGSGSAAGSATRASVVTVTATGVLFVPPTVFFEGQMAGGFRAGPGVTGGVRNGASAVGHVLQGTLDFYSDTYSDLYQGGEGLISLGVAGAVKPGPGVAGGQRVGASVMGGSR